MNLHFSVSVFWQIPTSGFSTHIADEIFCNDRSTTTGTNNNTIGSSYGTLGYGTNATGYGALARSAYDTITPNPSLVCPNNNDKFTVSNTKGNGANSTYCGRNAIDGATLDRFVTIQFDYDEEDDGLDFYDRKSGWGIVRLPKVDKKYILNI